MFQGDHLSGKNLKMSGNLTAVRGKILSGKSGLKLFMFAASLHPFLTLLSLCISFCFRNMHCCIPTPTTDNNTNTSLIWVTLNTCRECMCTTAHETRYIVRNFTLSGKWSPCHCTGTIKHNEEKIRKKLTLVKKDTQKNKNQNLNQQWSVRAARLCLCISFRDSHATKNKKLLHVTSAVFRTSSSSISVTTRKKYLNQILFRPQVPDYHHDKTCQIHFQVKSMMAAAAVLNF